MKKLVVGVTAAVLVLAVGTAGAFAGGTLSGGRYADGDGDGVCDFYTAGAERCHYADQDGDGVCDCYAACARGSGRAAGSGNGAGHRWGRCPGNQG